MKKALVVNFDSKRIAYINNPLERKVGETCVMKDGVKRIVYCIFDVNDWQDSLVRKAFRSVNESEFLDTLNRRAEMMIAAASDKTYNSLQDYNENVLAYEAKRLSEKYGLGYEVYIR